MQSPVRIAGVIDEDPWDARTWSGSSRYFFGALQQQDALETAVAALPDAHIRRFFQLTSFQPDKRRWRFRYHLNLGYYAQMTRVAKKKLAHLPSDAFNVVLQVGAWYDMTGYRGKPVVSYHDGNLASLLQSPYGYPRIHSRHLDRALRYERELYSRINLLFPMSEWLASSFMRDNDVPRHKLFPVGAGINLPEIRAIQGKSYDAPRILFVGKDFARKGGPDLLDAFARVLKEVPDAELTIIGPELQSPPPRVRCLGFISKTTPAGLTRLLDEFERASIFVLPSLYEPFGIAFAEAMAHRLPCIGTSICAMPEIIQHGVTGFVVPPRDPAAVADRIISLFRDTQMARRFGDAGYARYEDRFTWAAVTTRLLDIIRTEL